MTKAVTLPTRKEPIRMITVNKPNRERNVIVKPTNQQTMAKKSNPVLQSKTEGSAIRLFSFFIIIIIIFLFFLHFCCDVNSPLFLLPDCVVLVIYYSLSYYGPFQSFTIT